VSAFREVLRRLEKKEDMSGIPGLHYRENGAFVFGGDPLPYNIDALPLPDRTLTGEDRNEYQIDDMKPIALMRTSAGCPYRCTFCSVWKLMGGRSYSRRIESVVEELDKSRNISCISRTMSLFSTRNG